MLASFKAWFFLGTNYIGYIALVSSVTIYFVKPQLFPQNKQSTFFVLLALSLFTGQLKYGFVDAFLSALSVLPLFFIMNLRPEYQDDFLTTFRRFFSSILLLSLICWLLYYIGITTPYSILEYGDGGNGGVQYSYENHYFFLINISRLEFMFIPRFSAFFLEPGYLGCLLAMLLYIGKYKIDIPNVIFMASLIATFSLAGYILLLVGYFTYSLNRVAKRSIIVFVLIFSIICLCLYHFSRSYNNGNNLVNDMIIARVEYNEGLGRSGADTKQWFWNTYMRSDAIWFGGDEKYLDPNDVDWTAYVVQKGIISLILFVSFIVYPCLKGRKKSLCIPLSIIYLLILAQTIHLIQSYMYLIIFVLGINRVKKEVEML